MVGRAMSETDAIKNPPFNIEAEQSVLGGLMIDNDAWDRVAGIISERDFYTYDHRKIFRAIYRLLDANKPADTVSVSNFLQEHDELESTGGIAYLVMLNQSTPSSANIKHYAHIVRERALRRALGMAANEILDKVYTPHGMETSAMEILPKPR